MNLCIEEDKVFNIPFFLVIILIGDKYARKSLKKLIDLKV